MPELPEVETIRRGLNKFIVHKRIQRVEVSCEKSFIGPVEVVEGAEITGIRRRGKALLIDLSTGVTMMVHLRMTGQLIYRAEEAQLKLRRDASGAPVLTGRQRSGSAAISAKPDESPIALLTKTSFAGGHPTDSFFGQLPNKQTRVQFDLDDGTLFFNDQRKFGFVKVIPTDEVEQDKFIASLAPEPWQMAPSDFYQRLQRHKNSCIKAVLLDQKVICGLGNIYADEALFDSQIHPQTPAGALSKKQAESLVHSACKVMDASLDSGGSTMATYVRADGTKGDYLEKFAQVFRREGQECRRCGAEIIKTRVAGRGTHICPGCQQL